MLHATIQIDPHRGVPRVSKESPGTVRDGSRVPSDVRVVNLSTTGAAFASDVTIAQGTSITIGVPGMPTRHATIVWQDGEVHGCVFDQPVTPDAVARAGTPNTLSFPAAEEPAPVPPPFVKEWPAPVKLAIAAGGVGATWAALAYLISAALG